MKKKLKTKLPKEEPEVDEKEILEEIDHHTLECSCKTDPRFCPQHGGWY